MGVVRGANRISVSMAAFTLCASVACAACPSAFLAGESFSPASTIMMAVPSLGDLNGDGAIDVAVVSETTSEAQVLFGSEACARVEPGDTNGDDKVDIADAVTILAHLFSHLPARCPDVADVNGDHVVNIADAIYLLARLFAHGPAPLGEPHFCRGA